MNADAGDAAHMDLLKASVTEKLSLAFADGLLLVAHRRHPMEASELILFFAVGLLLVYAMTK